MIDQKTLQVGQKVLIQITGAVGDHEAHVIGHDSGGRAIVRLDGEDFSSLVNLKREDYLCLEILEG